MNDILIGRLCRDNSPLFDHLESSKGLIFRDEKGICPPYVLRWAG